MLDLLPDRHVVDLRDCDAVGADVSSTHLLTCFRRSDSYAAREP
jgi:hypothetical protein